MSKLIEEISNSIKIHSEEANRKLYQFEKNKLYDQLGKELVGKLRDYKCFIAGGTITSLFTGAKINDFDIYFRDELSCINFLEETWSERDGWINVLTKKSVLLRIDEKDVQLIHFDYFKSAEEIFNTFDFTVCMGAFDFSTEQFILHDEFMKHNSQRILKFNKNTAFPIVSLLRVHKYNKKFYTISKPEFLRIAMKCMTLSINNVDELKDHLGGMYGINYDKIINFDEGEEFSIDKVIDKIENLCLDEDYFKKPEPLKFEDIDEIIDTISKKNTKVTLIKDKLYKIRYNNSIKSISSKPINSEEVDGRVFIEGCKFYKFVKPSDSNNTYASYYDVGFKYEIGKEATAKGDYLYFNEKHEIEKSTYADRNGALLEVTIPYEAFHSKNGDKIQAKKCTVVREVPKGEYDKWLVVEEEEFKDPFEG